MTTNNDDIIKYTIVLVVINTCNSFIRNFDTFSNSIISIIISIGVKTENIISLWLVIEIIQNKNKDTYNIVLLLFNF